MGEHAVFGAYEPLIRERFTEECAEPVAGLYHRLLQQGRCGFIDYNHVPSPSSFFALLGPALRHNGCRDVTTARSLPRQVAQLPPDWEGYVRSLSSHERHFARMVTRVGTKKAPPFTLRVRGDMEALEDLIRLHSHVWEERGQPGYLRGRDGFGDFFKTLPPASWQGRSPHSIRSKPEARS